MSKAWWACLTVDTVTPRETSSGISKVIRVVLPLPLQPARPKIRIVAQPTASPHLGLDDHRRNVPLGQMLRFEATRPGHMPEAGLQIIIASDDGQQRRDPQQRLTDRGDRQ